MTKLSLHFDAAFDKAKEEVNRILLRAPRLIRSYTEYLTQTHGKMIRARAVLACAMEAEGCVREDAVTFAAAIEVLHLATLVHDDIMDDADLRRGMVTLQKKYGKRTAVICGDYLLSAAIRELDRIKDAGQYKNFRTAGYVEQICMGELRQNMNNRNYDLSMLRYLSIINGKTAALFEASYFAGALTHETEEKRLRLYRQLGRYTGLIFQLTDDCIDYENDVKTAGKSVQSDFEQGVITLPVIYTFWEKPKVKERAAAGGLSTEELINEVKRGGGIAFTHNTARRYYEKAKKALTALEFSKDKAAILNELLDKSYYGLKK